MAQKMKICPGCGAGIPEQNTAFCPYCGRELIDLGRKKTDQKIAAVQSAQSQMSAVPKKLGLVAAVMLLVLFLLFGIFVFFDIPEKIGSARGEAQTERLSKAMRKAYEAEDWEQLEKYLIDECEVYLAAPDYFCYRSGWYLQIYPSDFDKAYQAHDTEEMLRVYEILAEDYNMRADDIFYSIYVTDDAIEAALKEEVERETEILKEEGLEDEMYQLRF